MDTVATIDPPGLDSGQVAIAARGPRVPLTLVAIAVATILIPEDASFFFGDFRLTVTRALFIVLAPIIAVRFIGQVGLASYRFVWSDALVPVTGAWMITAEWVTEGASRAIAGAGSVTLEFVVAYFAARALLTERGQDVRFARLVALLLAVAGVLAMVDTLTGRFVTHDFFASLTGYHKGWRSDERFGSIRGMGPLEHPILLGTVCVIAMMLAANMAIRTRIAVFSGAIVGLVASISSAPAMGGIIGLGFFMYRRLTPTWEGRWRALMIGGGALLALFFLVLPNPFGFLISHITFDPQTGYYRLMVWGIAGALVMTSPIFGVGMTEDWLRPDWMPTTVDSIWLRSSMCFGIPGSILIALCLIGACSRRVDIAAANLSEPERRLGLALSIVMFLYIYLGFTVDFWGTTWILMGLFAGMRARLGALANLPAEPSGA